MIPSVHRIASRTDARVRRIRRLHERDERERTRTFYVEGPRFVLQALEHRASLQTAVIAPELLRGPSGPRLQARLRRAGVPCLEVTAEVFHSLSLADDPQGVGAVVRQRWVALAQVNARQGLCRVALDAVQSPGNLGTVLRTCDAVGAAGVILLGDTTDPYHPATVRASMGALFTQQFTRAGLSEFADWKERTGCLLVGTSPAGSVDYHALPYRPPVVLFLGSERTGLAPETQALCDVMVRIPMVGRSDSLNLAVAASVLLYEVFNQHRDA
uniref:RNA methyltransferase, TrmH family n=1 Tax=uncultured Armatimonadetes bacterium TaxID=157466 RepID=A0A6J4JEU0_9BACT|nr:RNA methyltransferase, TrmH family [uncultured Armatimonadetes bacterium]